MNIKFQFIFAWQKKNGKEHLVCPYLKNIANIWF